MNIEELNTALAQIFASDDLLKNEPMNTPRSAAAVLPSSSYEQAMPQTLPRQSAPPKRQMSPGGS